MDYVVRFQTLKRMDTHSSDENSSPLDKEINPPPLIERRILSNEHLFEESEIENINPPSNVQSYSKDHLKTFHSLSPKRSCQLHERLSSSVSDPISVLSSLETPSAPRSTLSARRNLLHSPYSGMRQSRRLFVCRLKSIIPRKSHQSLKDEDPGRDRDPDKDPVSVLDYSTSLDDKTAQALPTLQILSDTDELDDNSILDDKNKISNLPPAISRPVSAEPEPVRAREEVLVRVVSRTPSSIKPRQDSMSSMSSVSLSAFQCDMNCRNGKMGAACNGDNSFSSCSRTADSSGEWSAKYYFLSLIDSTLNVLSDGAHLCRTPQCLGRSQESSRNPRRRRSVRRQLV